MYSKLKDLAYKLWNSEGRKVFHTAWQVGLPLLLSHLVMAKSTADVKGAFVLAGAAALAAIKAILVTPRG